MILTRRRLGAAAFAGLGLASLRAKAAQVTEITIDWATYNPVTLVLKSQGLLEKEFAKDKIGVRWVHSAGSNKALEFLNAGSLDFGSTAGAAALIGKINGNPIKSIYVFSRPEWTALVTMKDSPIKTVADLQGPAHRGDPRHRPAHLPGARAGRRPGCRRRTSSWCCCSTPTAAPRWNAATSSPGPVSIPMMAAAEIESGARLFYRKPEANTWGVLNVREEFATAEPRHRAPRAA